MKPSTTASVLLGLLSAPALAMPSKASQQIEVAEGGVRFKVTRFGDGRTTPYRIYFWDKVLTGSSYRFNKDGDVVYFKAGSKVYYDRQEVKDGSVTFMSKSEAKHEGGDSKADDSSSDDEEFTTFDCTQCTTALSAVCDFGLPAFCDKLDPHCLHRDGYYSVSTLCNNYEGACATSVAACEQVCADELGESSRS